MSAQKWLAEQQFAQVIADRLLHYFDNMPSVRVEVRDDPYFYKSNALAFYREHIIVRPDYLNRAKLDDMGDTLMHELTHVWVDWKGLYSDENNGHNEAFIKKAISLGLDLSGTLDTYPGAKAIYNRLKNPNKVSTNPPIVQRTVALAARRNCDSYFNWIHPSEKKIESYFKQPVDWDTYYPEGRDVPQWVKDELQIIADDLLPLFDNMPRVKVVYDPCFWNYEANYYPSGNIVVIRANCGRFCGTITRIMKHEMVHAWQHWVGQASAL